MPVVTRMKDVSCPMGMDLATGSEGQPDGREKDIRICQQGVRATEELGLEISPFKSGLL